MISVHDAADMFNTGTRPALMVVVPESRLPAYHAVP